MQETELKVKLENPRGIRARLKALGAQRVEKFREIDVYFDTSENGLLKSDRVLRLRQRGKVSTIAFKGKRAK